MRRVGGRVQKVQRFGATGFELRGELAKRFEGVVRGRRGRILLIIRLVLVVPHPPSMSTSMRMRIEEGSLDLVQL